MRTKTKIRGKDLAITPAISDYLYKKLDHLKKFLDPADTTVLCEVELGKVTEHHKSGDIFRAEINLHCKGQALRAVAEGSDLYSAIDIVKDEMVRELQVNKDRRISAIRQGGAKIKNIIRGIFK